MNGQMGVRRQRQETKRQSFLSGGGLKLGWYSHSHTTPWHQSLVCIGGIIRYLRTLSSPELIGDKVLNDFWVTPSLRD
jgi:hypothetical protein